MSSLRVPAATRAAVAVAALLALTGCSSGNTAAPHAHSVLPTVKITKPPPGDRCAVDLTAPVIAKAVSSLPRDARSNQDWSPEPIAGNYNVCTPLSVVIVKANTNSENPATRALMFHQGQFLPNGVPDTFGFNGLDTRASTADTVALTFTNAANLTSTVLFHWNGSSVEIVGNRH